MLSILRPYPPGTQVVAHMPKGLLHPDMQRCQHMNKKDIEWSVWITCIMRMDQNSSHQQAVGLSSLWMQRWVDTSSFILGESMAHWYWPANWVWHSAGQVFTSDDSITSAWWTCVVVVPPCCLAGYFRFQKHDVQLVWWQRVAVTLLPVK